MLTVPGLSKRLASDVESLRKLLTDRSTRLPDGCLTIHGYGSQRGVYQKIAGRAWAHVASHAAFIGPIPSGFDVAHSCLRKDCIEPSHLSLKTHRDNCLEDAVRRMPDGRCGHSRKRAESGRLVPCATCNTAHQRRWRERNATQ